MTIDNQPENMQPRGEEPLVIPFSDDQEEGAKATADEDPDEPGISDTIRRDRKKRRGERISAQLREGKEAKEQLGVLSQQNRELTERLARLEGAHSQLVSQQAKPAVDPFEARLQEIEQQRNLYVTAAEAEIKKGTYTEERRRHYEQLGEQLDRERHRTIVRQEMAAQQPQVQAAVHGAVAQNQWAMQYPEVHANQRVLAWAQAHHQQLLAESQTPGVELIHTAYKAAQTKFGLGPKQPAREASASERSRLSGHSASGSAAEAGPKKEGGIVMTPELKRIARAAYPKLKPEDAYKTWAQKTGKRMRERGEL